MTQGLIGSNGVIGKALLSQISVEHTFNHRTIRQISNLEFDRLIIAAPSGNRRLINSGLIDDYSSVVEIVESVKLSKPKSIVLISSVDSIVNPTTIYGRNRLLLEETICNIAPTSILRLSSLIGHNIQKNVLFDIKHNKFLEFIHPDTTLQWCILDDLAELVNNSSAGQMLNIVSEPISNREVFEYFGISGGSNTVKPMNYNVTPYMYNKHQIFSAMEQYLK